MGERLQPQPSQPLARIQRGLLTGSIRADPGDEVRGDARLVRIVPRTEDWPAIANSLLVEASAPVGAGAVLLRYAWEGGATVYELPLEQLRTEGSASIWSCLLLVPKEKTEVLFSLAISVGGEEILLDDGEERFKVRFRPLP